MIMGKLLAQAAMDQEKNVTWMPSYGAEVRGGTAHSMVVISDKEIALAAFSKPEDCIVMNAPSFTKFKDLIKKDGIMVVNTSLIDEELKRKDLCLVKIPATKKAKELGNLRVANMVALGAYQRASRIVPMESLIKMLKVVIPPHHQNLIDLNKIALEEGAKLADEYKS